MRLDTRTIKGQNMEEGSWSALWHKWSPALLATPVMLAVYLLLAIWFRWSLETSNGVLASFAIATVAGCAVIALVSRAVGVYARRADIDGTAQRQGVTATQLAAIATWFIFPRMGIDHDWWTYALALMLVGVVGAMVTSLVAGRSDTTAPRQTHRFEYATKGPSEGRVAPKWVQRVAMLCLVFGVISFIRLFTDGTQHFLWGGIVLVAIGILLPILVVAMGGGTDDR